MRARQESLSLTLTRKEGEELRTQIIVLLGSGGTMRCYGGDLRNTPLAHLFQLLSGNFEGSFNGVNFVGADPTEPEHGSHG